MRSRLSSSPGVVTSCDSIPSRVERVMHAASVARLVVDDADHPRVDLDGFGHGELAFVDGPPGNGAGDAEVDQGLEVVQRRDAPRCDYAARRVSVSARARPFRSGPTSRPSPFDVR